jgi:hypothetical protein
VIVDSTDEFDRWLTNAEEQGGKLLEVEVALLQALNDLPAKPDEEFPTFKRARQARRHELWRVAHPYVPRRRCPDHLLVPRQRPSRARAGRSDKKSIGDVFYASAAARGEAIVDAWPRQRGTSHD